MLRVMIVDDHPLVREGVKKILRRETDMQVVCEASTAAELPALVEECQADVLILDINLPGRSGLDVLPELRSARPGMAVIVLSMHPEEQFALRALKAGARGYISKSGAADELIDALRRVAAGERYISPAVADLLARVLENPRSLPLHERLSERELQILSMIGAGKSGKQIADDLSISINTVNTHRARLLEKMGLRSNAELIRYAIEQGLV